MEVKPGYKQTEVGVIPAEWDVTTIGEQAQIFGRIGFRGYTVDDIVEEGHGAIAINPSNIQDGETVFEKCTYITWHKYEESPEIKIDEGDIILVKTGSTVGKTAMVKKLPEKATLNPQVVVFKKLKASPRFFGYTMGFRVVQKQLTETVVGGAVPTLSQKQVATFRFSLPPPPEQRAIAEALSDVDGLLDGLERLIAKKRDIKEAAMQQLLTGQTRLPGFHGEWPVKTFAELFSFSGGYSASRDQLSSEGHCYLHYGDIHGATKTTVDVLADYQNIPKLDIPLKRVASKSLLEDGDVVFVDASEDDEGTSRHVVVVNKDKKPFISGLHTIVAKSKTDELAHEYRRYCFQTAAIRQQFLFYAVGTKVSGISKTNIAKLTLPVPSVPEQTAIAQVLTEMDLELAGLEWRREKTHALKQGIMQELLTGKTRLI